MRPYVRRQRKRATHDLEPIGQIVGRASKKEVVRLGSGRRTASPLRKQPAVEDLRGFGRRGQAM